MPSLHRVANRIRARAKGIRWRRVLLRAAQVVVGTLVLYWIGANVFLRTSLGRNLLNAKPYSFLVAYESAYSLIPGRVHVEKLSIRGRSASVEWRLVLDSGDVDLALVDLVRRRFHATRVRADGADFRIRLRMLPEDALPDRVAALPPIEGYDDPPLRDFGPDPAPLTDAEYDLWTVQLDDVDVEHVREVWVHEERGVGDARLRGRWFFRPMRWLEVGPAVVDVRTLDLSHGSDPVITGAHGRFSVTIHPFDVRIPNGIDTFDHVSGDSTMQGFMALSKGFGDTFHLDDVHFVHGGGPFDLTLRIDHGVLAPGTRLHSTSPTTELIAGPLTFDLAVDADVAVDADPRAEKGRAGTVTLRSTDVVVSAKGGARAHATSVVTRLTSASDASLALAHPYPFADADVTSDAVDAELDAIEPWKAMIGAMAEIHVPSGHTRADAHFEGSLARHSGHGDVRFGIRDLAVVRGADRFAGNADGVVVFSEAAFDDARFDLSGSSVALTHTAATVSGVDVQAQRLSVDVKRAVFTRDEPPKIDLAFDLPRADVPNLQGLGTLLEGSRSGGAAKLTSGSARVVNAKATVALPARVATLSASVLGDRVGVRLGSVLAVFDLRTRAKSARWAWGSSDVDVTDADVVVTDLRATAAIDGKTLPLLRIAAATAATPHVSFSRKAMAGKVVATIPNIDVAQMAALGHYIPMAKGMSIDGGRASARMQADVDLGARSMAGTCSIAAHALNVRAGSKVVTSNVRVELVAKSGPTGESLDLSGSTVAIDDGEATGGPHGWWGRVDFPDAAMWWRGGLHLRASVHGRARDAEPAAVIVAGETILPEWVTRVFHMNGVEATAELRAAPSSFELRSFFARGSGGAVAMEYQTRNRREDGVVLLEAGELNLGIGLGASSGKLVLIDAHEWFDRSAAILEANAAR